MLSVMALALTFTFSSCSDDDNDPYYGEWDFHPLCISLDIQDCDGNSLLTTDANGSVVGEVVTLDYKDNNYTLDWSKLGYQVPDSRYIPAIFEGLRYYPVYRYDESGLLRETEERIIRIGELPKDCNYNETMALHYNGEDHVIEVTNSFRWIERPKDSEYDKDFTHVPEIKTEVIFDGMPVEEPFHIVIKK